MVSEYALQSEKLRADSNQMKSFLLAVFLLMQAGPQSAGVVTGVVRGANGIPVDGVRVYAIGVRDTLEALNTGTAPLEGLTQTDASGRYRLEVMPGRYYIASGSVTSPTFYPGTGNAAAARVVTVASGGLVESIDFSSFVPAARLGLGGLPAGTGVLSGVLRFLDGTPASGIPVVVTSSKSPPNLPGVPTLVSTPASASPGALPRSATFTILFASGTGVSARFFTTSDANGRFTVNGVPVDSYYIAAGYAESPTLYPGVTDLAAAKTITTTTTTNMTTLDLTVPRPPTGSVAIRGRVTALGNAPVAGARVELVSPSPPASAAFGLPSMSPNRFVDAGPDGRFEFIDVRSGSYVARASYSTLHTDSRSIVAAEQPVEDLDFFLSASTLSGRILGEDGSALADVRLFADVLVSTVENPNIVASTILQIASDGSFSRILEAGEYRFYLRVLPEEYSIKSIMTSGGVDLLKENLNFTSTEPVKVDVRVAKRTTSSGPEGVSVKGRTIDAVSGVPSVAERITFCCRGSGPLERFSSPIHADGSFEFSAIPPGHYAVGLQTRTGTPSLFPVGSDVLVGTESLSGLEVLSTPQFGELSAKLAVENGGLPPENFPASVVFTGANGRVRVVVAPGRRDGVFLASLPAGDVTRSLSSICPRGIP
jgi:hypothetical protein